MHLYDHIIPMVADDLENILDSRGNYVITSFRLSSMLHSSGVNVRHLFRIFDHLTSKTARAVVLVEMAARVVSLDIRRKFRAVARNGQASLSESNFLRVLTDRINLVFGSSTHSTAYWNKYIRKTIWDKFCIHWHADKAEALIRYPMLSRNVSFRAASMSFTFSGGMVSLHALFVRVKQILGFVLKPSIDTQLEKFAVFHRLCSLPAPFRQSDFESLGMRVKHMNVVSYAKGFQLLNQGLAARASDPKMALKYLSLSIKNFEDALAMNTASPATLRAVSRSNFVSGAAKRLPLSS